MTAEYEEAVDASAKPYRMVSAEISAAIFVETFGRRFRKSGETDLRCRTDCGVLFCRSRVKGNAIPLAGLRGGSPHLGAGAKRPARVEGKALAQSVTGTVT